MRNLLLFFGVALSGVYLWSSGLPQVSHLLLALLAGLFVSRARTLKISSTNWLLFLFCILSAIINLTYYVRYDDLQFIFSTIQNFYNFILFAAVSTTLIEQQKAPRAVSIAILLAHAIQWAVFFSGTGNYQYLPRYSGTFNDPNQMAFWTIATTAGYLILSGFSRRMEALSLSISCVGLVALTMSRSALVGVAACAAFFGYTYVRKQLRGRLGLIKLVLVAGATAAAVYFAPHKTIPDDSPEYDFIERIATTDLSGQADERGYSRFTEYPEYIFFGSGQGAHFRFNRNKPPEFLNVEMHTTWGGLLHYYGIAGFALACLFFARVLRHAPTSTKILILSTFVYGFSTYSFRTPIFWILLAIASWSSKVTARSQEQHRRNMATGRQLPPSSSTPAELA